MTRIKICGLTRRQDIDVAVRAGANAIGLVFYEPSSRAVTIEQAIELTKDLPPFVSVVALFVDATIETVNTVIKQVPIDCIQFHGNETDDFCRQFNKPFIKAILAKSKEFLVDQMASYPHASALLIDAYVPGEAGGTGQLFNWQWLADIPVKQPVILAGGLNPENVAEAVKSTSPYAVDVSGGVEKSKGIKDHFKIEQFILATRKYDFGSRRS